MKGKLPEGVLEDPQYTLIHAAILFADIQNSVLLSSSLSLLEYDNLINHFQAVMQDSVNRLRDAGAPAAEFAVAGDQLSLFFYDPEEVNRNYLIESPGALQDVERQELIADCRSSNEDMIYRALLAAIELKNDWLIQPFNTERVLDQQDPFGLSVGLHTGRVHLRQRPDGRRRIEGYAVNLAKRIETASRLGRYSQIMLSRAACEKIRNATRGHSQLRQRLFFCRHEVEQDRLKGVLKSQPVMELRFYHRLGVHSQPEAIPIYESLFTGDPSNIWAYYQLVDYFGYQQGEWDRARELAEQAQVVHPADEKVKYDLSRCHFYAGDYEMSREYCQQALALNQDFDLAYEGLAMIAGKQDDLDSQLCYMRKAVSLSPGSAVNHVNLGLALYQANQPAKAIEHLQIALRLWPEYIQNAVLRETLHKLEQAGALPDELALLLGKDEEFAAAG